MGSCQTSIVNTRKAMALEFGTRPRTLQRFLESIKWDKEKLRDRCQQIVVQEHAHLEAIGCVDESGTAKSGKETVGAGRQWNGNRGKIDNCVVGVHLSYCAPGFQTLLDSTVYLPENYLADAARRKQTRCLMKSSFAPNLRSPSLKSNTHCPTEFAYRRGRSTNCMAATADFSMVWNRWGKYL